MEIEIGRGKKARRAYGFDDIAIVPSRRTRDPDDVDITWKLGPYRFELPLLASAMDGVVSPRSAGLIGKLGGLAVLNLEGIFTRYEDAEDQLARIARLPKEVATREMQRIYQEPVKPELIRRRIEEIKDQGVVTAASLTPQRVSKYYELALEAGLDILVIQGTVVSAEHVSMTSEPLNLKEFIRSVGVPGHRRRLRLLPHGPAPHAHGRRGRPRRRRPGPGVHHARRARRRASRRPRRSRTSRAPARRTCSRRASTSRSSPTAGCARAATSPRRSPAARTPS
jgi:IMP dehydrogenase/GMP reductase